jgi:hypothetical protein
VSSSFHKIPTSAAAVAVAVIVQSIAITENVHFSLSHSHISFNNIIRSETAMAFMLAHFY